MFYVTAVEKEEKQFRVSVAAWCLDERLWKIYHSANAMNSIAAIFRLWFMLTVLLMKTLLKFLLNCRKCGHECEW